MAALGKPDTGIEWAGGPSPVPFVISFLAQLITAWVLAGIIGHMGGTTVETGLISADFCMLGVVVTTRATNHSSPRAGRMLTLIDGGHCLGVVLIQGVVIGLIGVK